MNGTLLGQKQQRRVHFDPLCDVLRKTSRGLAIIETSSTLSYEMTRRFHIRHGYEIVARISDFYALGDDKLILQKRLR